MEIRNYLNQKDRDLDQLSRLAPKVDSNHGALAPGWLFAGFIATQGVMWVALRLDKTGFEASSHDA